MNRTMKLAVISAFLALGIGLANAQDTNAAGTVVLTANVSLTGFKQSGDSNAVPVRITNKDIFAALNASGSGVNFGKNAKLVIVATDSGPVFQVREKTGTDTTITDVSGNLSLTVNADVVGKNGAHYEYLSFNFTDNGGNQFTVSGFATVRHGRITGHGVGTLEDQVLSTAVQVSGAGSVDGDNAVLRGTINAGSPKAELVQ